MKRILALLAAIAIAMSFILVLSADYEIKNVYGYEAYDLVVLLSTAVFVAGVILNPLGKQRIVVYQDRTLHSGDHREMRYTTGFI